MSSISLRFFILNYLSVCDICLCRCVRGHACLFIWSQKLTSGLFTLFSETGSLHWTWSSLILSDLLDSEILWSACLYHLVLGLQVYTTVPSFYVDTWDLNSGTHVCTESTLFTVISPVLVARSLSVHIGIPLTNRHKSL